MHRTQLLLETWQIEALRAHAHRAGISVSELVRRIVTGFLQPPEPVDSPLLAMDGIGDDPEATGEHHDLYLYGVQRRPDPQEGT